MNQREWLEKKSADTAEYIRTGLETGELAPRLKAIRKCLKDNTDSSGEPLVTMDVTIENPATLDECLKKLGLTFEEYAWMALEHYIEHHADIEISDLPNLDEDSLCTLLDTYKKMYLCENGVRKFVMCTLD